MEWIKIDSFAQVSDRERVIVFYPCYKEAHNRYQMIDGKFILLASFGGATHYSKLSDPDEAV